MTKRKNVSWRLSDQVESEQINEWLGQQKNIQKSITNVVMHMIDRFGVRNITDYDIQKILYQESSLAKYDEQRATKDIPYQAKPSEDLKGAKKMRRYEQAEIIFALLEKENLIVRKYEDNYINAIVRGLRVIDTLISSEEKPKELFKSESEIDRRMKLQEEQDFWTCERCGTKYYLGFNCDPCMFDEIKEAVQE